MRLGTDLAGTFPLLCVLLVGLRTAPAQPLLTVGPPFVEFLATASTLDLRTPRFSGVSIGTIGGERLEFKYSGVSTGEGRPNFIVVSPSRGVAPAFVGVGLNPNVVPYLRPGNYSLLLGFAVPGQPCPPACGGTSVTLRLLTPPPPSVTGVVNAATLEPVISPGAEVSILGTDLSTPPITAQYDDAGLYPTSLGHTTVTFNGTAAPLLYVSPTRINAVVPYAVAGQKAVELMVTRYDNLLRSAAFSAPLAETSPGIFTASRTGCGSGGILNSDGTVNSVDNPAPKGSLIQIFGTGAGVWMLPVFRDSPPQNMLDGSVYVASAGLAYIPRPAAPVSLTIGGQPARMQYMGPAPYQVFGMLQVNAVVPEGIDSGPQPVVLTIGQNSNSEQQVTVAVE